MNSDPELYGLLGIAVFERLGRENFRAVGEPPEWWSGLTSSWTKSFSIPFVEDYLVAAEAFWMSGQQGLAESDVFQAETEGKTVTLDVTAANSNDSHYLLIRNLDAGGIGVTKLVQTARENRLRLNKEIDEHVELQNDLSRAKEAAELLSQAKTQFLANVSHEIRTPLTAILGVSDLLADSELDAEQEHFVKTIQESSDHLLRIINDLLDFSRVESGHFELESIPIEIRSFAEQAQFRFASHAKAKGLRYDVSVGDAVPDVILGDPVRLAQILDNLVGNSLKFTEEGHVHAQFEMNPKNRGELLLLVADSGVGISAEKQELIFQSFVQEDASTTRRFGGTGLGLAIVKQLATVMGGDVTLESRPGKGTTFFVSIPVEVAAADAATHNEPGASENVASENDGNADDATDPIDELSINEDLLGESSGEKQDDRQSIGQVLKTASLLESIDWDDDEAEKTAAETPKPTSEKSATVSYDWDQSSSGNDWFSSSKPKKSDDWFGGGSAQDEPSGGDRESDLTNGDANDEVDSPGNLNKLEFEEPNDVFEADGESEWEPSNFLKRDKPRPGGLNKEDLETKEIDIFADEPLESFAAPSRDRKKNSSRLTGGSFREPKDLTNLRVLLAEDNAAIQMLLERMLKKAGHTVVTADNGKQAVEKMTDQIELVLMDCQMPLMDGFEATRVIRDQELEHERPRVPIIALTAHAMAGFREKCIAQGMDEYLTKPLNQADLETVINKTFGAPTR